MPITLSATLPGEDTVEKKIINKGLAYLLSPGEDPGEMHELNAILTAHREKLYVDDKETKLVDERYFSRESWSPQAGFGRVNLVDLQSDLPAAMGQDAKVKNAANEIDLIVTRGGNPGSAEWVVIECKAGSASSSGSQTNSYVEGLLERGNAGSHSYFAYCKDHKLKDTDYYFFFHKICKAIRNTRRAIHSGAVDYFSQFSYGQTGSPKVDLDEIIRSHLGVATGALPISGVYEYTNTMNRILDTNAGFKLALIGLSKSSKSNIRDAILKMIRRVYLRHSTDPDYRFWLDLSLSLEDQTF